jgi:hypothetical protein
MSERYQIVEDATGHKVNVIIWDGDTSQWSPDPGFTVSLDDGTPIWEAPPEFVTARQIRLALNALGLRTLVENFVTATGDQNVKDEWEYATEIYRASPLVAGCMMVLGKTDDERDDLFRLAATFG